MRAVLGVPRLWLAYRDLRRQRWEKRPMNTAPITITSMTIAITKPRVRAAINTPIAAEKMRKEITIAFKRCSLLLLAPPEIEGRWIFISYCIITANLTHPFSISKSCSDMALMPLIVGHIILLTFEPGGSNRSFNSARLTHLVEPEMKISCIPLAQRLSSQAIGDATVSS